MPTSIHLGDIALRLALTILAGLVLGYDRGEHGKAAGLRTTVLVCLAASVAMIQVNLLLPTAGRAADSFVMNDLMRLPLGILTGVGFIGAGAIIRRDSLITGVTTAATLWLATVIGLCIGGGQIGLGLAATALGLAALWGLKFVEVSLKRERRSKLVVELAADGPDEIEIRRRIEQGGISIRVIQVRVLRAEEPRNELEFDLQDVCYPTDTVMPDCLRSIASLPGVRKLEWRMRP